MITSFFKPSNKDKANPVHPVNKKRKPTNVADGTVERTNSTSATSESTSTQDPLAKRAKGQEVEHILSHLKESEAPVCWKKSLKRHFGSSEFERLANFVARERINKTVYPTIENTWSALNLTPLDQVKVVIVGQDPYHGPGQAHGLCFSVLPGQPAPPSLKNIYKELANDPQVPNFQKSPNHGHLSRWASQGVLMINTVLTVRKGEANSHKNQGWERVTDEILRAVDNHCRAKDQGVVFLLWGKPAAAKAQLVTSRSSTLHHVIITSHPSPLGATKTNAPFLGSRCFSRCNEALKRMGMEEIDWAL